MRMRVLVTVKSYPQMGFRQGEAVCVAGLRADVSPPVWVRLFPVPFRDLSKLLQFAKYQFVEVDVSRPATDRRPESWMPREDSIRPGEKLDTSNGWAQRRRWVEPVLIGSMCELSRRQEVDGTSLGAFRPAEVLDVTVSPAEPWSSDREALARQLNMFTPDKPVLEQVPMNFRYRYRCDEAGCRTHEQKIIDWEIGQFWRRFGDPAAIREKWLNQLAGRDKDVILFAGNMHQYPGSFLVLGVFWPPQRRPGEGEQLGLGV